MLGLKPGEKEIYSHPEKKLEEHLCNTVELVVNIATRFGLTVTPEEKEAILLHDIAKTHPTFQERVRIGKGGLAMLNHPLPSYLTVLEIYFVLKQSDSTIHI